MSRLNGTHFEEPRSMGHTDSIVPEEKKHLVTGTMPSKPGPKMWVISITPDRPFDGLILSAAFWGVVTHWDVKRGTKGRSSRCEKDKFSTCDGCEKNIPIRSKFYLHVLPFPAGAADHFLEITNDAAKQIIDQCPSGHTLRGFRLQGKRHGGAKGRIVATIQLFSRPVDTLPPGLDPEPFLEQLWQWD